MATFHAYMIQLHARVWIRLKLYGKKGRKNLRFMILRDKYSSNEQCVMFVHGSCFTRKYRILHCMYTASSVRTRNCNLQKPTYIIRIVCTLKCTKRKLNAIVFFATTCWLTSDWITLDLVSFLPNKSIDLQLVVLRLVESEKCVIICRK